MAYKRRETVALKRKPGGRSKIRSGVDLNAPKQIKIPPLIDKFDDSLVGKRVWFFDPHEGVKFITVTGLYSVKGRGGRDKWGLWYDYTEQNGRVHSKTLWVRDYPLFKSRQFCQRWVRALLEKSVAEGKMNRAVGLETMYD